MISKKTLRVLVFSVISIVICSLLSIIAHAVLPAKVDVSRLDSVLVEKLGFPVVAIFYFVILYTHCVVVINMLKNTFYNNGLKSGLYFGLVLALLYMAGMQEIMLSVSPFDAWGSDFVIYQLLMGLGDAIPVIVLCSVSGKLARTTSEKSEKPYINKVVTLLLFTIISGTARTILSQTNIIDNSMDSYPIAVSLWNYSFGFVVGIGYLILRKHYKDVEKWMIWGVAVNWIIFNSFIGLIKDGALHDALLRSMLDGIVIVGIVWLIRGKTGNGVPETPLT